MELHQQRTYTVHHAEIAVYFGSERLTMAAQIARKTLAAWIGYSGSFNILGESS